MTTDISMDEFQNALGIAKNNQMASEMAINRMHEALNDLLSIAKIVNGTEYSKVENTIQLGVYQHDYAKFNKVVFRYQIKDEIREELCNALVTIGNIIKGVQ